MLSRVGGTLSRAGLAAEKSFLHDAFHQLDEVLKRRSTDVNSTANPGASSSEPATEARERRRQIREADQMIQRWLVVFAREHLGDICVRLMKCAREHYVPPPQSGVIRLPHAGDEPEDPSEYRDDSSTFFLLETLRRVLCAAVDNGGGGSGSANLPLRQVPEGVLVFCFERVSLEHPTAIRHVAGQCVGVLSRAHLKATVELFLTKVWSA